MSIRVRVIEAGGSVSVSPCKLVAIEPGGSITDEWSRTFAAPDGVMMEWGSGTAPTFNGTLEANTATIAYLDF